MLNKNILETVLKMKNNYSVNGLKFINEDVEKLDSYCNYEELDDQLFDFIMTFVNIFYNIADNGGSPILNKIVKRIESMA